MIACGVREGRLHSKIVGEYLTGGIGLEMKLHHERRLRQVERGDRSRSSHHLGDPLEWK